MPNRMMIVVNWIDRAISRMVCAIAGYDWPTKAMPLLRLLDRTSHTTRRLYDHRASTGPINPGQHHTAMSLHLHPYTHLYWVREPVSKPVAVELPYSPPSFYRAVIGHYSEIIHIHIYKRIYILLYILI